MARPLRIEIPGGTYHVTSRGNEKRSIFRTNKDRETFLQLLGEAVQRFGWNVTAWVLMSNHFHVVIQTPEPNLSRGMQWLLGSYVGIFNKRHRRSGHLFQGRFKSIIVEKERHFANLIRYVVLNPVRAGIVARPEDYRWSSYRSSAALAEAPKWFDMNAVLESFGGDNDLGRAAYRQFVLDNLGVDDPLWQELNNGIYLGSEQWAKLMREHVESKPRSTDHPVVQRAVGRPKMHEIVAAVAKAASVTAEAIREIRGHPLRALIVWLGWHEGLQTLRAIAASLRLRSEGHMSNLVRRCAERFSVDRELLGLHDAVIAALRA
jgi:REP element-mobilizing transposase RayT